MKTKMKTKKTMKEGLTNMRSDRQRFSFGTRGARLHYAAASYSGALGSSYL